MAGETKQSEYDMFKDIVKKIDFMDFTKNFIITDDGSCECKLDVIDEKFKEIYMSYDEEKHIVNIWTDIDPTDVRTAHPFNVNIVICQFIKTHNLDIVDIVGEFDGFSASYMDNNRILLRDGKDIIYSIVIDIRGVDDKYIVKFCHTNFCDTYEHNNIKFEDLFDHIHEVIDKHRGKNRKIEIREIHENLAILVLENKEDIERVKKLLS